MNQDTIRLLRAARVAEKEQALFYRNLTGQADERGDAVLAERLNELLADEQHHLSRLTARLLELGLTVEPPPESAPMIGLEGWEPVARERETLEVARYEALLAADLDDETRGLIDDILTAERNHERQLGGKWMMA